MRYFPPMSETMPPATAPRIPDPQARADPRLAILSIFGLWALYFVLNTLRMMIAAEAHQLEMLALRTGVVAVGIVLSFCMYAVLRRLEARSMRVLVTTAFLVSIPLSFAYAVTNYIAFYIVSWPGQMQELAQKQASHDGTFPMIVESAVSWYFFIAAWGVLYVALSYAAKVRQAERSAALYRSEAQNAQLRALRYQINPHFLFNTLNSLSALVLRQRTPEAERMITNLATFFRSSLTGDPTADVALSDEIAMQRLYLDIELVRFPERLKVVMDVPENLAGAQVPGLILQPLVENAVRHGIARTSRSVTITIRARAGDGVLRLSVEDDADGETPAQPGGGVGLANVRERLARRFDGQASMRHGPRAGGGFAVVLTLPLQCHV
jgi:hypothetical protein